MLFKRIITYIAVPMLMFGCLKKTSGLKQSDIEPLTSIFLSRHVKYNQFTDELSERTLSNLLNYLDPGKYYFIKSDIDSIMLNKDKIDDYVRSNDFSLIFKILELYKKRYKENLILFNDLIKKKYNFQIDETIVIDRDKIEYSKTKEEVNDRWRKNIKLQLLNQLENDKNIEKAKNKIKKKYDLLKKRIDEIDKNKMISIFINAFTTALDPHSNYLTQEEHEDFQISTNLKLEGIGVLLRSEDGYITVERIIPGGAAAKLPNDMQLKPNDKIVAVAQADDEQPIDVVDMALRDVVKLIRGKKGTVVKLTLLREISENNKKPRLIVPITREEIKLEDKAAKSDIFPLKKDKAKIKIGYIKLPSFYMDFNAVNMNNPNAKRSSRDVIIQINKLKNKKIDGVVVDLRGNPGGALTEAVNIAGMFIDEGPIVQIMVGKDNIESMNDRDPGVYYDGPIVLLIDKFSASASEIFAGAIKDYKRGIIVGSSSTFGKGTVQTYNVLPGENGAMKITTAIFYQPGGSSNQLHGISPDISIPDISSIWDMGENKLRNPLKWKKIKKAKFTAYKKYIKKEMIPSLKKLSSKRIKKDNKFIKLIKKIKTLNKKRNEKTINLKEESKIESQKMKDMKKKANHQRDNEELINIKNDLFLKEAFNITYDYIKMLNLN